MPRPGITWRLPAADRRDPTGSRDRSVLHSLRLHDGGSRRRSVLELASQNVHWQDHGAFTAEISAEMLLEHGVAYTIVGHSEPRKYFSESDEQINHRARCSQAKGLIPIVCVGESDEQRERGEAERVIRRQIEQGLERALLMPTNWWWPRPIWAIGTGKTCESAKNQTGSVVDPQLGGCKDLIIQYGGDP
ncbi:MAG: hypothetical protein CM15mP77_0980 [Synechococcus sp.]|nr:MAG: hypothetical protein CM15mP77_0980 [Synechococcus sp.]